MNLSELNRTRASDASDRDSESTGQARRRTWPTSGSQQCPDAHPAGAPLGTTHSGSCDGADGRASRRHASADSDEQVVVLRCVSCRRRLRWRGRRAARTRCPHCGQRLIARCDADGVWNVYIENDDSLAGMICDWLGKAREDED